MTHSGGNPYHDRKGKFATGPGAGGSGSYAQLVQKHHANQVANDGAVVNVPLSKRPGGDLNAQIDRHKRQQAVEQKQAQRQNIDNKKSAKALFGEYRDQMVARYEPKLGKGVEKTLKDMATFQPKMFLDFLEKFKAGK